MMAELILRGVAVQACLPARVVNHVGIDFRTAQAVHCQHAYRVAAKIQTKRNCTLRHSSYSQDSEEIVC